MVINNILRIKRAKIFAESEQRRIRLVLISDILGILITSLYIFLYLIIDKKELMPEIIGLGLFILIYSLSVFFLYRGLFILSKYTLMLSTMGSIIMGSVFLLGKTPGIHIYFLLFAILPIVIFSFREKLIIVVLFLLNLICFLIVEIFLPEDYPLLRFPGKYEVSFHILSNVITFTLIAIIILLYQWLTEENEKELHKQSEQLRELNATKDKFFSIIAHDLRNPFNAILNSSKLLIMKFSTYSEDRKFRMISAIHESSTNLSNLLENLLLWSQLQSKKIRVYNEEHDLAELVEENIDLYRKSLKNKEIELEKYLQPNIKISTDRYIVSLVMRNLISNAIKFTKSGGRITISLRMNDPEFVEISVKDSGIGIKEEDIPHLFDSDKLARKQGTDRENGSGLGLSLCKDSLEKLGGYIEVLSRVNEGSEFIVYLKRS